MAAKATATGRVQDYAKFLAALFTSFERGDFVNPFARAARLASAFLGTPLARPKLAGFQNLAASLTSGLDFFTDFVLALVASYRTSLARLRTKVRVLVAADRTGCGDGLRGITLTASGHNKILLTQDKTDRLWGGAGPVSVAELFEMVHDAISIPPPIIAHNYRR
jgi:hypothetical protein